LTRHPASSHRGLRLLALCAVALGLLLLAAAAFVLSYTGVHAVALAAGVSPRLARIYPLILDAMVVVAGAAVLSLRGAGLPSRWYAWLSLLVMLAADAGADTLHAVGTRLPHKQSAAAAAIIPWALLLIGFSLLLAMLRHARVRARREPGGAPEAGVPEARPVAEAALIPETDPVPETDPIPETDPVPVASPLPSAEPGPGAGAEVPAVTQAEPIYGLQSEDDFETDTDGDLEIEDNCLEDDSLDADNEDAAPSGPGAGAPESASGPGLKAAGFERVRSTPLPPGE
jgi:hypothetical protein